MEKPKVVVHWFRRDLRLHDNHALHCALNSGLPVLPIFIFDKTILNPLKPHDARVNFIHEQLRGMKKTLQSWGSNIYIHVGTPQSGFEELMKFYDIETVFANRDYETYAQQRDHKMFEWLKSQNIQFIGKKDHVIFEKNEIVKDNGNPYTVYTPYSKKWKMKFVGSQLTDYEIETFKQNFYSSNFNEPFPELVDFGFEKTSLPFPNSEIKKEVISLYHIQRDIPSISGTSMLSVHLRFGTISIRHCVTEAQQLNEKWLNELIWRDFYQMIMYHFPHTESKSFKPIYDRIEWRNNEEEFNLWCEGKTGYPIVDAGMRELNATGFMHNRVRMIVASFLTKHLLIDWRWGERYFAEKLLDFELASNVGGWQWAAGSGCDAAPYFRVFNPQLQTEKFDPQFVYIKKWIPEINSSSYPTPMVDHAFARNRCLEVYKSALK
ncbi:MAG: cryptochrome/photolyase family protein [Bacteroidota bacterium]